MPLITLCGYPCSGKSTVASKLTDALQTGIRPQYSVCTIAEPVLSADNSDNQTSQDARCSIYGDSIKEREFRALHKSEVERALTRTSAGDGTQSVVIMDAGNQIKGYRYELFCLAKSLKHQHAVVFCDTPADTARQWNAQIQRYPVDLLNSVMDCFESPQPNQRWDSPLFLFHPGEYASADEVNVDSLVDQLREQLFESGKKNVKPNRSTELATVTPAYVLQELERVAQLTCEHIMTNQSLGLPFADVPPSCATATHHRDEVAAVARLNLQERHRKFTHGDLARAKRRFITMQRAQIGGLVTHDIHPASIASAFLLFIDTSD